MAKNNQDTDSVRGAPGEGSEVGTSAYTYRDDLGAELHPSDVEHTHAMFHGGGQVPAKTELKEVVLGPPAFGSPDPRTLGHRMNPGTEDYPDSAPRISEDYAGGKPMFAELTSAHKEDATAGAGGSGGEGEKTWSRSMKKDELLQEAQNRGLDVNEENTKEDIVQALEDDDSRNEQSQSQSDGNQGENQ